MSTLTLYLVTAAGVLISFILPPILRAAGVQSQEDPTASIDSFGPRLGAILSSRASAVTAASLILALLVVALLGDELQTWEIALLSGMGWQSILARVLAPGT